MATTEQSRKIEVKIEPGAEGVIRLVAVPPVKLDLQVVKFKAEGRLYKVRLEGSHKNLTPASGKAPAGQEPPTCSVEFTTRTYRIDRQHRVEGVPLQLKGDKCVAELEVDVFEAGFFGDGKATLTVTPDFPFAPAFKVSGTAAFDNPLNVEGLGVTPGEEAAAPKPAAPPPPAKGAAPGKQKKAPAKKEKEEPPPGLGVLLGKSLTLKPVFSSAFEKSTLRLSILEGGTLSARRSSAQVLTTFEWTADANDKRVWRVGHAESDDAILLTYLETRQDSYGYDLRCEIVEENGEPFIVWERKQGLTFPRPRLKSFRVGRFGVEADVENVDPSFKLPLELSLWSCEPLSPGSPVHVMAPVAESSDAQASSTELFLDLVRPTVLVQERKKVFALLRIPRTLSGTEDYVPVSAVMDYDENTHLTFDDDQLWLEPPTKGKTPAKAKKTPKELATAVASEELTPGTLLTRLPYFGEVSAGVRDNQLLLSFRLVGEEAYWKDAAPAFSLQEEEGTGEPLKLGAAPSALNPHVYEALVPLDDKRVLGKKLRVQGQVTQPGAKLWDKAMEPPVLEPRKYEAVPQLSRLSRHHVELTDETTYLKLRCHARHIPNGKKGTVLTFRVYELVADLDDPILMSSVKIHYTLPRGDGGSCDARGWWEARITDKESLEKISGPGRFRVEACVEGMKEEVFSAGVARVQIEFGGARRKVAGQLIWGDHVSEAFRNKVFAISDQLKVDPQHLMACMAFETGREFKANTPGKSSPAVGLIQFIPGKFEEIFLNKLKQKVTREQLMAMTELQQLDYVQVYLQYWIDAKKTRLVSVGDIYASIIWPAAIGEPDDFVFFRAGSDTYARNAGLDKEKKGYVTKADASAEIEQQLKNGWEHRR